MDDFLSRIGVIYMQRWLQLWKMDLVQKVSHGVFEGSSEEPAALMNHDYIVLGEVYPERDEESGAEQCEQDCRYRGEAVSDGFLSSLFGRGNFFLHKGISFGCTIKGQLYISDKICSYSKGARWAFTFKSKFISTYKSDQYNRGLYSKS